MADRLVEYLKSRNIKFVENYTLSRISSIKIGGTARLFAEPECTKDFVELVGFLEREGDIYKVVGRLTNTLFASDYNGLVISTSRLTDMNSENDRFTFGCGTSLAAALAYAARSLYGGAEQLRLIPGSIGGAVFGNAGAHGLEIADIFESARIYIPKHNQIIEASRKDMSFGYRYSCLKSTAGYITDVTLKLLPTSSEQISINLKDYILRRRLSQPNLPSLGSIFKRADGVSAGYYIDRAGLKGVAHGGAVISSKHAGFIVNTGNASIDDVIWLIKLAKSRVYELFGVVLEEEIQIF